MTGTNSPTEETVSCDSNSARKSKTSQNVVESSAPSSLKEKEITQQDLDKESEQQRNYDFGIIPIPSRLRYNSTNPFRFCLTLNIAFGLFCTFTVANLYYCQPLLIQISQDFCVTHSEVSKVPTLVQAGYASGLLLITPLGDLVRRRPLILTTVILSTSFTIGLAVTNSLIVFEALSFIVGAVSVTPQVLIPLVADLAPDKRRASAISIIFSGLLFGILVARVLAGIIGQFVSWRVVYFFAIGVQGLVLLGSYLMLPDYPSKNKDLTYWNILWTMAKFSVTEPVLIQACLINMCSSACLGNFWVTLTFLLGGSPYHYSTLVIGLFGLIGMAGVSMGPICGHLIDKLVPWYGSLISILMLLVFQALQTVAGGVHVAVVIIVTFGIDISFQNLQVSLSTKIFGIEPAARARLNAVNILSIFIGGILGTSAGTHVFIKYGWRAGASLSLGWSGFQLFVLLLRGPHCKRHTWFGYEGGLEARRTNVGQPMEQPPPADVPESQSSSLPEKKPQEVAERSV